MDDERKEYTFLWRIENYSFCIQNNGESFNSPEFTAEGLEGTAWYLELYPRGCAEEGIGNISIFLTRSEVDEGPDKFFLKFNLFVLRADGSYLFTEEGEFENGFERGVGFGDDTFVNRDMVLNRGKADYLPQDTLTVLCKMWIGEGKPKMVEQISALTRIGVEQISFLHVIENFSTLQSNQKKTIEIRSSKEEIALSSNLCYSYDLCSKGNIVVEIAPSDTKKILSRCKISLLDKSGKAIECARADNRFDTPRRQIDSLQLSFSRAAILNEASTYLPNDELSLQCECIFSTGVEFEKIEKSLHNLPNLTLHQASDNDWDKNKFDPTEKLSACTSATEDMKAVYINKCLTDVGIKTKTKSFPAHKIVLCARSTVFKAMLTNDMKEKNTNSIQVDDLENETMEKFLIFLYSDVIENLEWESAIKLYYAGDKYAVERLKVICSSFLVDNLSTTNASELLLLADTHNDSDLKKAVEDFIFKHEEEVYGSEEWRNLIETNSVLVSKTMCLKYMRN